MKKILVIFFCLILNLIFCCDVHAYGVRVQKDFRYTTQQDRNQRIKTYKDYLEKTGIFYESHSRYKQEFKPFKKDNNYKKNRDSIKHKNELSGADYKLKGNYYQMADNILANYSVIYNNDPYTEYIYDMFGNLYQVVILTGEDYILPHYKAVYSFNGYLQKVRFFAVDGYEYIFLADGTLQGVVIENKLYNSVGRPLKVWLL